MAIRYDLVDEELKIIQNAKDEVPAIKFMWYFGMIVCVVIGFILGVALV